MDQNKEEKYWLNLENIFVHSVYENISNQYDNLYKISPEYDNKSKKCLDLVRRGRSASPAAHTNFYNAWPKVKKFIDGLEPHSLIADVNSNFYSIEKII